MKSQQEHCEAWISLGDRWGNRTDRNTHYYDCQLPKGHKGQHAVAVRAYPDARYDTPAVGGTMRWPI